VTIRFLNETDGYAYSFFHKGAEDLSGVALEGLCVIEAGHAVSAPFCGTMLADFGAEVIKIEPPQGGDLLRGMGNFKNMWFAVDDRNKKCITLDLRSEKGKALFAELLRSADVFLENYRPGAMAKMGFGWEDVQKINPRLIMASVSGYGQTGPYKTKPGFDRLGMAMGGLTYITGYPDRAPLRPGLAVADYLTGMFTLSGVLMALYNRDVVGTGKGQHIDSSLYESIFRISEATVADYSYKGVIRERVGNAHISTIPGGHYLTRDDKYLVLAVGGDKVFTRFAELIGRKDLVEDERFKNGEARHANRDIIDDIAAKWIREHTLQECLDAFGDDIPNGAIYSIADIMEDPHFKARDNVVKVDAGEFGSILMQGVVPKLSETPGEVRWAGPEMGAFNREIYTDKLGLSSEEVEQLRADGVI